MTRYCVFEYCYRDSGNWKTYGRMLLRGSMGDAGSVVQECLEWGNQFVAEQVGVPALYEEHFRACGDGPSALDHAFHEFVRLRPAIEEEIALLPTSGSIQCLLARFRDAAGRWDVTRSPYYVTDWP